MQAFQLPSHLARSVVAAALGAGALLAASSAHAIVVYSGPVNIVVPATTAGIYINVVTGASGTAAATPGWDINPWGSAGLGLFSPAAPAGGVYVMIPGSTVQVANLAPGATVGAAGPFGSGSNTAANAVQWTLNSSANYFGFRFNNESGGTLHYGWAQLAIGATITDRRVIGYAFESTPGTGILVGDVGVVPEPATYAMMSLGVLGLLAARRRAKR